VTTEIESPVVSTFGMGASPWIAGAFYGGLAALQLGTGVAYAADGTIGEPGNQTVKIDVIAITAIASSIVTLILGLAHAYSAYLSRKERDKTEREEKKAKRDQDIRWQAVQARLALLEKGYPCELEACPVIKTIRGEIDFDAIPFGKPVKEAKPDEPTVDLS